MAHYAFVRDGMVVDIIVAEQEFVDWLSTSGHRQPVGVGQWIQTSYNTHGNVHEYGNTPLRKNFAGIGYFYDAEADAFYPPKPYDTWVLNTDTYLWEPPFAPPNEPGKKYAWDIHTNNWIESNFPGAADE
jgi:hypothetical protein